jgi:hypothetical protein
LWKIAWVIKCILYTISRWIDWYSVSTVIVVFSLGTGQLNYLCLKICEHNLSLSLSLSLLSRFLWWRKNLKRTQHLHTKTGIGFFRNSRSTTSIAIFFFYGYNQFLSISSVVYISYILNYFYNLSSGKMLNKRRLRLKRRKNIHLSLLHNNLARWESCF